MCHINTQLHHSDKDHQADVSYRALNAGNLWPAATMSLPAITALINNTPFAIVAAYHLCGDLLWILKVSSVLKSDLIFYSYFLLRRIIERMKPFEYCLRSKSDSHHNRQQSFSPKPLKISFFPLFYAQNFSTCQTVRLWVADFEHL